MGFVGDYADFQNGFAFKSKDFSAEGDYKVIKIKEIKDGKVKFTDDTAYVNHGEGIEKYVVENGDVLFALTGDPISKPNPLSWVGRVSLYISDDKAVLNQRVCKLIPKEGVNSLYLYYFFRNTSEFHLLAGKATGSASQANISTKTIADTVIDLPDLAYQNKVVGVLQALDKKIELNNSINDNLLQQAQAIYMHIFGDNSSVTAATIADIALNVTDGVHNTVKDDPEGQYLLLSCKNIKGGLLSIGSSERKINSETFEKLRRRTKLAKGDILISSVGTVGELLLLNTDPSNYEFQRSVAIVKPNPELVSSAYVYEALVAKKAELINAAHGAVQQCLFISDIAGFPIGIPNPAELRSFDEVVKPMFDTITANEAENLRLEVLRDTLLPKLMSGELEVSELDL